MGRTTRVLLALTLGAALVAGLAVPAGAAPGPNSPAAGPATGGSSGEGIPTPPLNDDFADAGVIGGNAGTIPATNLGATGEVGEPQEMEGHSVWFSWTATFDDFITFDTLGSDYDTVLGVYTGTSVDGLTAVAFNDDASGLESQVAFATQSGTEYFIAISGYGGDEGNITLNWGPAELAGNDDFAAAQVLTGPTGSVGGRNISATLESGEPDHAAATTSTTVWYEWTAPATGEFQFDTYGTDFDTVLAAYTGTSVDELTEVAANDDAGATTQSEITLSATLDTTYRIVVGGAGGDEGLFELFWSATNVDPPANDDLADRQVLTGDSGSITGTNVSATNEPDEPVHSPSASEASVWYSITSPTTRSITVDLSETGFSTVVAVYTDTTSDSLTPVASAITWLPGTNRVRFLAEAGDEYAIAVDGSSSDGPLQGLIRLSYRPTVASFSDVPTTSTFFDEIEWMSDNRITTGFPDGFRPAGTVTRQAMAAFMYRLSPPDFDFVPPATPSFTDVPTSNTFYEEIEYLVATGVIGGFPDSTFRPANPVTRQAMSAFMYRLAGYPEFEPPATPSFTDVPLTHSFFDEIEWMADTGITTGFPGDQFRPGLNVTRQAMSAFMQRLSLYLLTPQIS